MNTYIHEAKVTTSPQGLASVISSVCSRLCPGVHTSPNCQALYQGCTLLLTQWMWEHNYMTCTRADNVSLAACVECACVLNVCKRSTFNSRCVCCAGIGLFYYQVINWLMYCLQESETVNTHTQALCLWVMWLRDDSIVTPSVRPYVTTNADFLSALPCVRNDSSPLCCDWWWAGSQALMTSI